MFFHHSVTGGVTTLLVYMDDIIVTGNDKGMETLWGCLVREFEIKELGKLMYFLEIEMAHSKVIILSPNRNTYLIY